MNSAMGYTEGSDLYIQQPKHPKKVKDNKKRENGDKQSPGGILYEPLNKPDGKNANSKDK